MSDLYDLVVIGGGVNGAGVARDAAGRGAQVLLLEAHDLASGTSSKSTKLVHGGLRYLEYYEFALVREALGERETLWRIAPHIVWPMRFVLPVTAGMRPRWMLRAGLFLYDHIGGRTALPKTASIDLARHPAGAGLAGNARKGLEYSDCWADDARLVALNAMDARRRGATVRTHCPLTGARRNGDLWEVEAGGERFAARALVNAAGPGADDIARLTGREPAFGIRRVRGSHIVLGRKPTHDFAYLLQLPDTRICFVIPYEQDFTLVGTTDRDHAGSPVDVAPGEDEIDYLLAAYARHFADPVTREDIVHTYAGVRALVDTGDGKPEAATRGYRLALSKPEEGAPVLGIYGGKITSYRAIAEDAVDMLADCLPALSGPRWTAGAALPGGAFAREDTGAVLAELRAEYPFLSDFDALRIARGYGLLARDWLGAAKDRAGLGHDFGCGLSEAEADYLRREEWARDIDDVLWRRSKLGLRMDAPQKAELARWLS